MRNNQKRPRLLRITFYFLLALVVVLGVRTIVWLVVTFWPRDWSTWRGGW